MRGRCVLYGRGVEMVCYEMAKLSERDRYSNTFSSPNAPHYRKWPQLTRTHPQHHSTYTISTHHAQKTRPFHNTSFQHLYFIKHVSPSSQIRPLHSYTTLTQHILLLVVVKNVDFRFVSSKSWLLSWHITVMRYCSISPLYTDFLGQVLFIVPYCVFLF